MRKYFKHWSKVLVGVGIFCAVLLLLGFFANYKIESTLEAELPKELSYKELEVNILTNNLVLELPKLQLEEISLRAREIRFSGFGYFEYLRNGNLHLDKLLLEEPHIRYTKSKTDTAQTSEKMKGELLIESLEGRNGSFSISGKDTTAEKLFFPFEHFRMTDVGVDQASLEEGIPFTYESYEIKGDSLFLLLDGQHTLTSGESVFKDSSAVIEQLKIIPRYDKQEFQQHIPYEKDRFDLAVEELNLQGFEWRLVNDSLLLENRLMTISGADLEVYRNKLLPDDTSIKTMYSEKIRTAPVKLGFEKVQVKNSAIVYQERTKEKGPPAEVSFTELHASIFHLTNIGMKKADFPTTQVWAKALLMGEAPLTVDWSFDSSNLQEEFSISGKLGALSAEGINSFLKPALGVETQGGIASLSFDYHGNNDQATGDMELKYSDFRIEILRDDGSEKNGFLSTIANWFINDDAINEDFRHENLTVVRDKTKSFWNYLWLCIRKGALDSLL